MPRTNFEAPHYRSKTVPVRHLLPRCAASRNSSFSSLRRGTKPSPSPNRSRPGAFRHSFFRRGRPCRTNASARRVKPSPPVSRRCGLFARGTASIASSSSRAYAPPCNRSPPIWAIDRFCPSRSVIDATYSECPAPSSNWATNGSTSCPAAVRSPSAGESSMCSRRSHRTPFASISSATTSTKSASSPSPTSVRLG